MSKTDVIEKVFTFNDQRFRVRFYPWRGRWTGPLTYKSDRSNYLCIGPHNRRWYGCMPGCHADVLLSYLCDAEVDTVTANWPEADIRGSLVQELRH